VSDDRPPAGPEGSASPARRALGFLTPIGGASAPAPAAVAWFPVVGALLGAVLGGLWWATGRIWPAALAAALVVALDLGLTGMLHFDGLVDSVDALVPHLSRERRLEVMRDPHVGAFGLGAGGAVLLLRWAALAAIHPSVLLLMGIWAASRTAMAVVATTVPYARPGGLASAFLERGAGRYGMVAAVVGTGVAVASVMAWHPLAGPVSLAAGVLGALAVVWLAARRLGGFTGDVLGAAGMVLETVALVVAAAKW